MSGDRPKRRKLDAATLEALCAYIAEGNSLRSWAAENGHTVQNVSKWLLKDEERAKVYREARRLQADALIDELIELADEEMPTDDAGRTDSAAVQQLRLRVDTRKWVAAKFYPALYGDKVALDANVNTNIAELPPDQIMGRIVDLLAKHGLRVVPAESGSGDESDGSR